VGVSSGPLSGSFFLKRVFYEPRNLGSHRRKRGKTTPKFSRNQRRPARRSPNDATPSIDDFRAPGAGAGAGDSFTRPPPRPPEQNKPPPEPPGPGRRAHFQQTPFSVCLPLPGRIGSKPAAPAATRGPPPRPYGRPRAKTFFPTPPPFRPVGPLLPPVKRCAGPGPLLAFTRPPVVPRVLGTLYAVSNTRNGRARGFFPPNPRLNPPPTKGLSTPHCPTAVDITKRAKQNFCPFPFAHCPPDDTPWHRNPSAIRPFSTQRNW